MTRSGELVTCPAIATADCPTKGSGAAGFLVAPSILLDPAPPVAATEPPASFPSAPKGMATTEFDFSLVRKKMALFEVDPHGWDEASGAR